jgi:putative phage-type endonuclease
MPLEIVKTAWMPKCYARPFAICKRKYGEKRLFTCSAIRAGQLRLSTLSMGGCVAMTNRTDSIGASDAPKVICGPQFPLWAEKTGLAPAPDLDHIEAVKRGTQLEPLICEMFREETGRKVRHNAAAQVTHHPDLAWMTATLDATQHHPTRGRGALEIKNVGEYLKADWEEEPGPLRFQIQLQHQLAVTGLEWGSLCALIGGNKLRWFDMDREQDFIDAMIDKEAFFWTQVLEKQPPAADGSIATREALKALYPEDSGQTIALPPEAAEWDTVLQATKAEIKSLELEKRELENKIKGELGNNAIGVLPSGGRYTFKTQTSHYKAKEAYDSSFRVLRRCK